MLSSKSIRLNFLIKLSTAMAVLLILFSLILYKYITFDLDREMREALHKQAHFLFAKYPNLKEELQRNRQLINNTLKLDVHVKHIANSQHKPVNIKKIEDKDRVYLIGYFPYNFSKEEYLTIKQDITTQAKVQNKVLKSIIILNILMMIIIIIYAYILSGMLLSPIKYFNDKLAKMNVNMLEPIDLKQIPVEFRPLGRSINHLTARINSFLKYKKELFIGAAHEMKTPLAVIRAKCQLALIRKNPTLDECKESLKETISSIDNMNRTVSSILEFGRAEGAQFDKCVNIDISQFLIKKIEEYKLIAENEDKDIKYKISPPNLKMDIQPLLFEQIIRNLIQNALRFSPPKSAIKVSSYIHQNKLYIKIRDEGVGIEENIDLFSPFKRSKNSSGTGLGLFLVKSAADAMGAKVDIKNRKDKKGVVATVELELNISN